MSGGDSLQLVLPEIFKQISNVNESLAFIGLLYIGKTSLECLLSGYTGFKTYILSKLVKNDKWLKSLGSWAIVTGCTHGIGLAYAKELAKRGFNLILISRNKQLLDRVSSVFEQTYNIQTLVVVADLSDREAIAYVEKAVVAKDIGILVNNVGTSHVPGIFHEVEESSIDQIINVNIRTLTLLTRMVLPDMVKKNKGAIVNVSSGISRIPSNFLAMYSSTKAFTDKFTETLQYEYRQTGIFIQCLNTGGVKTKSATMGIGKSARNFVSATDYASSAIRTLGYSKKTSGYWPHSLQYSFISFLPSFVLDFFAFYSLERLLSRSADSVPEDYEYDDFESILNS